MKMLAGTRRLLAAVMAVMPLAAALAVLGCGRSQQTAPSTKPVPSKAAKRAALQAAATSLTAQERKVPHYFGPFPNWANSPFTLADATIVITGDGTGATAIADVGANGAITGITVTNPGTGYTNATVTINSATGTGAAATANVVTSAVVNAINLGAPGAGYTAPLVTITGGGGSGATAIAYGGVDHVAVTTPGSGYTFPTVEFDMPDAADGVQATGHATMDGAGAITGIVVDSPGSGYAKAPGVTVLNGTRFKQIAGNTAAVATATLSLQSVGLDAFGTGYTSAPTVAIADSAGGTGTGATATATIAAGGVGTITVTNAGSGYVTSGGIKKFVDTLPGLTPAGKNNLGQYIPVAKPDTTTFPGADYYEIALVEYTEQMHSSLPPTKLRGYVQLQTSTVGADPAGAPITVNGRATVDKPHYLGPTIVATRDRPVRITFYNFLPTGAAGDLFLPVDSSMMGSGMGNMTDPWDPIPSVGGSVDDDVRNPMCTMSPKMDHCYKDNRATLHLHGGNTPWISDGTPHQWITPANESTPWPEGVSVKSVPDMVGATRPAGVPDCSAGNDGCMTFYYTNQQSARLMFYHDHAWGITRLNVYAGEAAGYLITDDTEKKLVSSGTIPPAADTIPLIIQDRTFVPATTQLDQQDPTWDVTRWGGFGSLWYHHVYMPAQNPNDPGGMSAYGRWMYGPWFWPPATDTKHGPIANPYYSPACKLDDPTTWQYQTDPFCEPPNIPGTPNISAGMEQFNDTPVVNGTVYPTTTVQPKAYRFRILNAANDRFWNLSWYVADSTGTEVALNAAEVAAAQLDPVVFPTPDTTLSPPGPSWIQIGSEGGFLPAPTVIPPQPITWITDPTRFDVGNVDLHSLVLAPAERADVIVDFSKFAGKTLILYNDAPAAYPARVPSYDYYTGAPDLSPVGAPKILPGYGPNTRTVMQVVVSASGAVSAFDLNKLKAAFSHKADGSGVFEAGQHPIIVGQAPYNSAYGTAFAAAADCSMQVGAKCDGYARIAQQGGDLFTFDTLLGATGGTATPWEKLAIPLKPKAIHDEMNSTTFDEFGRMQATLGVEVVPATATLQSVILFPYTFPPTEIIDTTNSPKANVQVTPIATTSDGTQIWKFTHNGVDTHPVHFHAFDVQVLNRITWDNILIPPDPNELGWKDTVRMSPLEDTIVALRPVVPVLPFELPNSIRRLSPMQPLWNNVVPDASPGGTDQGVLWSDSIALTTLTPMVFNPQGEPIDVYNHLVNFGAEYVFHCHILSHEEMDMMRPVILAYPPKAPTNLTVAKAQQGVLLSWMDNSIAETAYAIEKLVGATWTEVARLERPLDVANTTGVTTFNHTTGTLFDTYRVVALNTVGDTWNYADPAINTIVSGGFPTVTVRSDPSNTTVALFSVRNDFNGDGKSDVVWRNGNTGAIFVWAMNGSTFTSSAQLGPRGSPWVIEGIGDFDGDGSAEVLWRDGAGNMYLWTISGSTVTQSALVATVPLTWKVAGVGDFDGNGTSDVLWRGPNGEVSIWYMAGATLSSSPIIATLPSQWVSTVGDFDGDKRADILWRNTQTGEIYIWTIGAGSTLTSSPLVAVLGSAWTLEGTGDFDGDGKSDLLWRNRTSGEIYAWFLNGAQWTSSSQLTVGSITYPAWAVVQVGDFDGDGRAEVLWRASNGDLFSWKISATGLTSSPQIAKLATQWQANK